jgi:hypothetical protein
MQPLRNNEANVLLEFFEQGQRDEMWQQTQPDFDTTQGNDSHQEPLYNSGNKVTKPRHNPHPGTVGWIEGKFFSWRTSLR